MPDLRFIPLASSSHGNAYLLDDGKTCLLIECGVSYKKLQRLTGFGVSGIIGCLISHEHHDHAGCYEQLIKSGIPVYASRGTAEALECDLFEILEDRERVTIGSLEVLPFPTFHDAAEPMGFLVRSQSDGEKLVFATDTVNLGYQFPEVNIAASATTMRTSYPGRNGCRKRCVTGSQTATCPWSGHASGWSVWTKAD